MKLGRARVSARAEADIRSIAAWIARDSEQAALKWARELHQTITATADTPGIGTDRSHLRRGLRSVPFGNYLIFFKPTRNGIQVARVIHGARNYRNYFK